MATKALALLLPLPLLLVGHMFQCCLGGSSSAADAGPSTKFYDFKVEYIMVTMLCHTRAQVAVNGQYPGPPINVREGDHLIINVTNKAMGAILTIHWHGIHQVASPWADGAAFVTQCPIPYGHSYIYDFQITAQCGTLFWHAHVAWVQATVYGAFIIRPSHTTNYPFSPINDEATLLLGEWWSQDFGDTESQLDATGGLARPPDANTINGLPGSLYKSCLESDEQFKNMYILEMPQGNTYLLRVINAALQATFIFTVANHTLTVVEADGAYTKPFNTEVIFLAPGQTMSVLLHGNQPPGWYSIVACPASSSASVQAIPATSLLFYSGVSGQNSLPCMPDMAYMLDNPRSQLAFHSLIKSYSAATGSDVPMEIDRYFFFAMSLGIINSTCPKMLTGSCQGPDSVRFVASLNNISYVLPTNTSILEMLYGGRHVATDFPDYPSMPYNYTGDFGADVGMALFRPIRATKLSLVDAGEQVEMVLQDTRFLPMVGGLQGHALHLHGYSFYVVGGGMGTFDPLSDPMSFNVEDPPLRNTVSVPSGGWSAIRFKADNPGVWFLHCHIETYQYLGMQMAFWVRDGPDIQKTIPPPPQDLPHC